MGRTARDKRENHPKPVQKIALSEKNTKIRIVAVILLLALGAVLIAYSFLNFLNPETQGWTVITPFSSEQPDCSEEFVLQYKLISGSPSEENNALRQIYTDMSLYAYRLFNEDTEYDGINNIRYINSRPNQKIRVDGILYNAFSLLEEYSSRYQYLAPVLEHYDNIFFCTDDSQTADFDPRVNPDVKSEYYEIARFARDPESVDLKLLGNNTVELFVSPDYLQYAENEGITQFIAFGFLKNAFITDYFADALSEKGFTHGNISSFDGYVRNLDDSGEDYSFNLFDKKTDAIYQAGVFHYNSPLSIVFYRNFSLNSMDSTRFYAHSDGVTRTNYLDIEDGVSKNSLNNLVAFSYSKSCSVLALESAPVFISESFDPVMAENLTSEDVFFFYPRDFSIVSTCPSVNVTDLYNDNSVSYNLVIE